MEESEHTYQWARRNEVMVRALTNRLYQQERQRIMEWREGAIKATSLIAGSAAIARIADPMVLSWAGAVVVLGTTLSLVFGFGSKARDAAKRATEWAMLDRDIHAVGPTEFTAEQVNTWAARCNEIEAGEPAANALLLQRSYERACAAIGAQPSVVSGWLSRLKPIIAIP
ncbi:hypothetical protein LMG31506_00203 [Cupriavidus yeoncheonensis]|uniref:SLATT domain-containing protein n=1 Tax=Cupriavidus yeoncheonensis TaxID=1462994 RepID=A0A916IMZ4_9BURK|nr:hypothetical protein [Cupriavidus yeoncheonensis]CAG2126849.1 hypothetical protein LMG31506_00203 [Cupriavidus yeoncheonensis]